MLLDVGRTNPSLNSSLHVRVEATHDSASEEIRKL